MVSRLAKPQCGQVNTDSRATSPIVASHSHGRRRACICGRTGQASWLDLLRIIGDGGFAVAAWTRLAPRASTGEPAARLLPRYPRAGTSHLRSPFGAKLITSVRGFCGTPFSGFSRIRNARQILAGATKVFLHSDN